MSYDSKYSGAVAEQMLDDYVAGNLGGEGGAKVYNFDLNAAMKAGAVTQDVYDAIIAADVVMAEGALFMKVVSSEAIQLNATMTSVNDDGDGGELVSGAIVCTIGTDLSFTAKMVSAPIPTKTSQLTNDSGFITAADIPTSAPERVIGNLSQGQPVVLSVGDSIAYIAPVARDQVVIRLPGRPTMDGYAKECGVTLAIKDGVATSIIYEGAILWANNEPPTIESNHIYEFTFKFNFSVYKWLGICISYNMG